MSVVTRESILTKLFTIVIGISGPVVESRRLVQYPNVSQDQQPALFLIERDEDTRRKIPGVPPTRYLTPEVWYYYPSGTPDPSTNISPGATAINTFLDALEAAILPDNPGKGTFTLGGLVQWCRLEGRTLKDAGNFGTQALGIAKLRILIP